MTTAVQIADWLVKYRAEVAGAPIDAMSLEKNLFYAQGFFLAIEHKPLFLDEIQAWRHGPVVPTVYHRYKAHRSNPIEAAEGAPPDLDVDTERFLCDVVAFLSPFTATLLSDATHAEDPWVQARAQYQKWENSTVEIKRDDLALYFATLIDDGENALSAHALLDDLPEPRWGSLYMAGICARRLTHHPFYRFGRAIWQEKLWESPEGPPSLPKELFKPPKENEPDGSMRFSTIEEYRQLREAEKLATR